MCRSVYFPFIRFLLPIRKGRFKMQHVLKPVCHPLKFSFSFKVFYLRENAEEDVFVAV